MKNRWIVRNQGDGYYEAVWTGPAPRTQGPYGECVGVFNTSLVRAASCCDTFNEYQDRRDRAEYHLARADECETQSLQEWIALNAAGNAATGFI